MAYWDAVSLARAAVVEINRIALKYVQKRKTRNIEVLRVREVYIRITNLAIRVSLVGSLL